MSGSHKFVIELYDTSTEHDVIISQEMIAQGHAQSSPEGTKVWASHCTRGSFHYFAIKIKIFQKSIFLGFSANKSSELKVKVDADVTSKEKLLKLSNNLSFRLRLPCLVKLANSWCLLVKLSQSSAPLCALKKKKD